MTNERIGPPRAQIVGKTIRLTVDDKTGQELVIEGDRPIQQVALYLENGLAKVFYRQSGEYQWDGMISIPVDDIGGDMSTLVWQSRKKGNFFD